MMQSIYALAYCIAGIGLVAVVLSLKEAWDDMTQHLDMSDEDWTHHL